MIMVALGYWASTICQTAYTYIIMLPDNPTNNDFHFSNEKCSERLSVISKTRVSLVLQPRVVSLYNTLCLFKTI